MSLKINDAGITVQISRETRAPSQAGFGSVCFLALASTVSNRLKYYSSMAAVALDYNEGDEAYEAAQAYYSQVPTPVDFYVGEVLEGVAATPGTPAIGSVDFSGTVAAGDGTIGFNINTDQYQYTPLIGDSANTAAKALASQVNAGNTHTGTVNGDVLTLTDRSAGVQGNTAVITDISTDSGAALALTQPSTGTDPTPATSGESLGDALDAMANIDPDFYCVCADNNLTDIEADITEIAQWVESNQRVFFNMTVNQDTYDSTNSTCIASVLKTSGYQRTLTIFHQFPGSYPTTAAFAIMATTSYRGTDTVKTLKFKDLAGQSVNRLTPAQLEGIKSHRACTFYEVASIRMFDDGVTSSGYFIDEIIGSDAMAEEIRVRVFGLLSRVSTKIPYNERGMAQIEGEVEGALTQYVTNGFLTSRVDENGDILAAYRIWHRPVIQASAQDKAARIAPDIQFTARVAGAVHEILINGVLTLD